MHGQYIGLVEGSTSGTVLVDIDKEGGFLRGSASFFPRNQNLPASCAHFPILQANRTLEFECPLFPLNRFGYELDEDELATQFPGVAHSETVRVFISFEDDEMHLRFLTDLHLEAKGVLTRRRADAPSQLKSLQGVHSWTEFTRLVEDIDHEGFLYRGQAEPFRLRTSFHRTHRKDLARYLSEDLTAIRKYISPNLDQSVDWESPDGNGALFNLLQHHGYPTPLLDWTRSAYVAAFFAFRHQSRSQTGRVRVFFFDYKTWSSELPQFPFVSRVHPHLSVLELGAASNNRVNPQHAVTTLTNLDDIENYIAWQEQQLNKQLLFAVDIDASERTRALRSLDKMNITAEHLFPGVLDSVCERLRNRSFLE
tara:strand:+ start:1762 stop:2862 length:1101 start_codon:yes stop_codon:yes gene_type:complete